jgi:hypothetical protein
MDGEVACASYSDVLTLALNEHLLETVRPREPSPTCPRLASAVIRVDLADGAFGRLFPGPR